MKRQKLPLVLEQLEDRIFLDANPLVMVDGAHDHAEDPNVEVPVEVIAEPENTEHHVENPDGDSAGSEEHAASVDDVQTQLQKFGVFFLRNRYFLSFPNVLCSNTGL